MHEAVHMAFNTCKSSVCRMHNGTDYNLQIARICQTSVLHVTPNSNCYCRKKKHLCSYNKLCGKYSRQNNLEWFQQH